MTPDARLAEMKKEILDYGRTDIGSLIAALEAVLAFEKFTASDTPSEEYKRGFNECIACVLTEIERALEVAL